MSGGVFISALGMASSLGPGVKDSAAAVRAGLSRFAPLEQTSTFDEEELEAPLTGSPVTLVTKGFVQQARLLRLVKSAFRDFLSYTDIKGDIDWGQLPIIWCLPELAEVYSWPENQLESLLREYVLAPLAKSTGLPLMTPQNGFFVEGNSGASRAIRGVARSFDGGHFQRALCIAVDSLIEPRMLALLESEGRLKAGGNPVGLMPGEAAAITLLETGAACAQRNIKPEARVLNAVHKSLTVAREAAGWRAQSAYEVGRELGKAILEALSTLGESTFYGDIYLDLNGEEWRAVVWSAALLVLKSSGKVDLEHCREQVCATSWGDVGAASGLANTCLALRSMVRRYAKSNLALVCSVSDEGNVGVLLLGNPQ